MILGQKLLDPTWNILISIAIGAAFFWIYYYWVRISKMGPGSARGPQPKSLAALGSSSWFVCFFFNWVWCVPLVSLIFAGYHLYKWYADYKIIRSARKEL